MKFKQVLTESQIKLDEASLENILLNIDQNKNFSLNKIPAGAITLRSNPRALATEKDVEKLAAQYGVYDSNKIQSIKEFIRLRNNPDNKNLDLAVDNYKKAAYQTQNRFR